MEKWEDVEKRMNEDLGTLAKSIIIILILLAVVLGLSNLILK